MKEIYCSSHIWTLFEDFMVDMGKVQSHCVAIYLIYIASLIFCYPSYQPLFSFKMKGLHIGQCFSVVVVDKRHICVVLYQVVNTTHDRKHADTLLESYVTTTIPEILTVFFNSPFSEASTIIKVFFSFLFFLNFFFEAFCLKQDFMDVAG